MVRLPWFSVRRDVRQHSNECCLRSLHQIRSKLEVPFKSYFNNGHTHTYVYVCIYTILSNGVFGIRKPQNEKL